MHELSEDGHYVVINHRRWRATDPAIPDAEAQQLREQLMSARRAVKAALSSGDDAAERSARERVQLAKVGLGERGTPWWEQSIQERRDRWQHSLGLLAGS